MKREILFRGKRKDNGEWVEGFFEINTICSEENTYLSAVIQKQPKGIYDCESWEVDSETVGQYTGNVDKNGVKIFEGDIVNCGGRIYEIVFLEKYARFAGTNRNCVFSNIPTKYTEVIGNIYDSPNYSNERK